MQLSRAFGGKHVVITGGSSGIGLALAANLTKNGANVSLIARNETRLQDALSKLNAIRSGNQQRISTAAADVSDADQISAALSRLANDVGPIDVLINSAGISYPAMFAETPVERIDSLVSINLLGTIYPTQAVVKMWTESKRPGHIVNIASLAGEINFVGFAVYSATKAAVIAFSDALRNELMPHGITVSVVLPPDVDTPMLAEENRIKPAITKAISGGVQPMSAEAVAETILRGVARKRFKIVPGASSKLVYTIGHYCPWIMRWALDRQVRAEQSRG